MTSATHRYDPASAEERRRTGNGGHADDGERLTRALGVFSIGLGLAQVLAPRNVARAIGVDGDENQRTVRAVGFREIATGVGLLTQQRPARFVWGRVTGDAMDLALLGRAFNSRRNDHGRLAAATAAVAGVTILDLVASQRLIRSGDDITIGPRTRRQGIQVRKAITIKRTPEEVYRFWRHLENLPRFMAHLESVRVLDDRRSYWKAHAPLGLTAEWTAEIVEERPNELISWRSVEDSQVPNSGTVRFVRAPGDRGTEVRLDIRYDPPAGAVGAAIAKLFGEEPSQQVDGDLRRLKQVLETGEVVHSDSSIHRGPHPARPPKEVPSQAAHGGSRSFASQRGGF
jgi:uncharacterized membrane protein